MESIPDLSGKMMTPYEAETGTGSQELLVERKGWWERRTVMEKVLLSMVGVVGVAMLVMGVAVANPAQGGKAREKEARTGIDQEDVCLSPECVVAGTVENIILVDRVTRSYVLVVQVSLQLDKIRISEPLGRVLEKFSFYSRFQNFLSLIINCRKLSIYI